MGGLLLKGDRGGVTMRLEGERIRKTRMIQRGRFVVVVEVELVIPQDSFEPCLEPDAVKFLKEVEERAERGDKSWLLKHGTVYELVEPLWQDYDP